MNNDQKQRRETLFCQLHVVKEWIAIVQTVSLRERCTNGLTTWGYAVTMFVLIPCLVPYPPKLETNQVEKLHLHWVAKVLIIKPCTD